MFVKIIDKQIEELSVFYRRRQKLVSASYCLVMIVLASSGPSIKLLGHPAVIDRASSVILYQQL